MGKPSTPSAAEVGQSQQAVNTQAANQNAELNRVNQTNPFGSSTWSQNGTYDDGTPRWSQQTAMSPALQQIYNTQLAQGGQIQRTQNNLIGQIQANNGVAPQQVEAPQQRIGTVPGRQQSLGGQYGQRPNGLDGLPQTNSFALGGAGEISPRFSNGPQQNAQGFSQAQPFQSNQPPQGQSNGFGLGSPMQTNSLSTAGNVPVTGGLSPQQLGNFTGGLQSQVGPGYQNAFDQQQRAAFGSQMGYLQPQQQQQTAQLQNQLAQQGITEASNPTAYNNALTLNNNSQNFVNQQAYNSSFQNGLAGESQAFGQGLQNAGLNNQTIGQALGAYSNNAGLNNAANAQQMSNMFSLYNAPVNQLSALNSLSQVQNPVSSFQSTPYAGVTAPNTLQLQQQQYQNQLGNYNNTVNGLYSLGGSALAAYGAYGGAAGAAAGAGTASAGGATAADLIGLAAIA